MSRSIKTIITNKEKQRKKELFKSVEDIKKFMLLLSHVPIEDTKISEECEWFSSVNYTTMSEYAGELKKFIERLSNIKEFSSYSLIFDELKGVLMNIFAQY